MERAYTKRDPLKLRDVREVWRRGDGIAALGEHAGEGGGEGRVSPAKSSDGPYTNPNPTASTSAISASDSRYEVIGGCRDLSKSGNSFIT